MPSYPTTTAQWQEYLAEWPDPKREIMLNEWNRHFDFYDPTAPSYHLISVEEMALSARRAAFVAANLLSLMQTDWPVPDYFLLGQLLLPRTIRQLLLA